MKLIDQHLITLIIFTPLLGLIPLFILEGDKRQKLAGFFASLIPSLLTLRLFSIFEGKGEYEFQEVVRWFREANIFYRVGVDGISLPLVALTTFLMPIIFIASWNEVKERTRGFVSLFLILETAMLGAFLSLDLFLFYVFWEAMLIPMYFLIGIWGGGRRVYAAMKFVLFTLVGSLLMLAAILYLYFAGGGSFNLQELLSLNFPINTQLWLFAAFALAFAIKIPLFPFHTWLPDAHVEAPTTGSVILAGVLLKMGTYGFIRFAMPLFPQAVHAALPVLLILSVIGIIYGALVSLAQPDLKKLIAYSSVSHLGFVMLGLCSLTPQGVAGATLQMVNHGLSTGALFLLVGMLYERRHTREIRNFGGIATPMPLYTFFFIVVALSSLGLPGTNGFVGEFLILIGTFRSFPVFASLGAIGVILSAAYLLWMIQRVFFGPLVHEENRSLKDLSAREVALLVPILLLIFWIGIAPGFLLKPMEKSVDHFLSRTGVVTHDYER